MDITEICADIRNYFPPSKKRLDKSYIHSGTFTISSNSITPLDFIKEGQFFRIVDSDLNNGVYQNTPESLSILTDEEFEGEIWEMAVPRSFLDLCKDIDEWRKANESADSINMSPFTSESFGGYSYSKGGSSSGEYGGNSVSWQSQFSKRLNIWRKI